VKVIGLFLTTKMIADRKRWWTAVRRVLLQMLWTHITGRRWPGRAIVPDKVKYPRCAVPRLYRYQVWVSGVPRNFVRGGFNKFGWGQRTERTEIWGR